MSFVFLFLLLGSKYAAAAVLQVGVGMQYETIQAAIDVAVPSDEIEIEDGIYIENIVSKANGATGQTINIVAKNFRQAIIQGTMSIEHEFLLIRGLVFNDAEGAAIGRITADNVVVEWCEFRGNRVRGDRGTVVLIDDASDVKLRNNAFEGNDFDSDDVANDLLRVVHVLGGADNDVVGNWFRDAEAPARSFDLVIDDTDRCDVTENGIAFLGFPSVGGLQVLNSRNANIQLNAIFAPVIFRDDGVDDVNDDHVFSRNSVSLGEDSSRGTAVRLETGGNTAQLDGLTFDANLVLECGGSVWIEADEPTRVRNTALTNTVWSADPSCTDTSTLVDGDNGNTVSENIPESEEQFIGFDATTGCNTLGGSGKGTTVDMQQQPFRRCFEADVLVYPFPYVLPEMTSSPTPSPTPAPTTTKGSTTTLLAGTLPPTPPPTPVMQASLDVQTVSFMAEDTADRDLTPSVEEAQGAPEKLQLEVLFIIIGPLILCVIIIYCMLCVAVIIRGKKRSKLKSGRGKRMDEFEISE